MLEALAWINHYRQSVLLLLADDIHVQELYNSFASKFLVFLTQRKRTVENIVGKGEKLEALAWINHYHPSVLLLLADDIHVQELYNSFASKFLVFLTQRKMTVENIVGKGENAGNLGMN